MSWLVIVLIAALALGGAALLARRSRRAEDVSDRAAGEALPPLEVRDALRRQSVPLLYFSRADSDEGRRLQDPAVFMLNSEFEGRITVIRRDLTEHAALARQFGVDRAPATVVFDHHGRVAAVNRGYTSLDELRRQVLGARSLEWTAGA